MIAAMKRSGAGGGVVLVSLLESVKFEYTFSVCLRVEGWVTRGGAME